MRNYMSFIGNILLVTVLLLFTINVCAQNDSIESVFQKYFNEFNSQIDDKFNGFKSKNDSVFHDFLGQSWEEYSLMLDQPTVRPKPKQQPTSSTQPTGGIQIIYDKIIDKAKVEEHEIYLDDPDKYMRLNSVNNSDLSFHGIQIELSNFEKNTLAINSTTEQDVANYYKEMSLVNDIDFFIDELLKAKSDYNLNDWAFLDMLSYAAKKNYNSNNEQTLFIWYVLLHVDYQVKIGFNSDDLYLLLSFTSHIYNKPYLIIDECKYYVFNHSKHDFASIHSYAINHPDQQKALSLLSNELPRFPVKEVSREIQLDKKVFQLAYNQSLTEFYKTYPLTELAVYLKTPLSMVAKEKFAEYITPEVQNMSDREKLNFLLHFIQYSFPYQSDEEQFSAEKYMFAEETLSYQYTDCEDRVVLLDKLVKEYTNLNTIVLLYPEHVVLGVEFPTNIKGSFVPYQEKNYYIADPTYLGAKFGVIMEEYKDISPQILLF